MHFLYTYLFFCVFQASQPDELTIDEQEMLEVIEDGDMEDWVKVYDHTHICVLCLSHLRCLITYTTCWLFVSGSQ